MDRTGEEIMFGKWRYSGGALVVALAMAVMPLQAQRGQGFRGQGFRGPQGPNMGYSLELALEHQDELELTQDQVARLLEVKALIDGDVGGLVEEMNELRENIRAGEVEWDEGGRQIQALRGELITASAPLRGRAQEILTVEQHNKLQPLVRQDRLGGGRMGALQGRGMTSFQGRGAASFQGRGAASFQGRGAASFQGRGGASLRGRGAGMGMPGQLRGSRGGVELRRGFYGQGRAPALGFRHYPNRGIRSAPFFRRGPGAEPLVESGGGGSLP